MERKYRKRIPHDCPRLNFTFLGSLKFRASSHSLSFNMHLQSAKSSELYPMRHNSKQFPNEPKFPKSQIGGFLSLLLTTVLIKYRDLLSTLK